MVQKAGLSNGYQSFIGRLNVFPTWLPEFYSMHQAGFSSYVAQSAALLEKTAGKIDSLTIEHAIALAVAAVKKGLPILVCGNGGSASDAAHITGELVGRFLKERRPINAISLSANTSVLTAWANDYDFESVYSRQIEAHGKSEGVLIALSTSGTSKNIVHAAKTAKTMGMKVIALTGEGGGALAAHADALLAVPSTTTPLIQQAHLCLYHYLCAEIEARCFD